MAAAVWRGRAKGVTDPLDDKVKARLRGDDRHLAGYGGSSTGSEHEGACEQLPGFVDGFFFSDQEEEADSAAQGVEREDAGAGSAAGSDGEVDLSLPPVPVGAMVRDLLKFSAADRFRRDLVGDMTKAIESVAGLRFNRAAFRRAVMSSLRESGYNAGICKARWESHGGITAGNYEYIDVVREPAPETPASQKQAQEQQKRYIVDVEFAGEFEIARPTAEYAQVAAELPRVYVGKPEELKRLLKLLADAAKRSLRAREMHVPPWRKSRYMQAKWLGSYRRTLNPGATGAPSAAAPPPASFIPGRDIKYRCVGFDPVGAQRVIPPAARAG
ncbi:hypothetical protein Taro_055947 [Colocasia esculenta]|uniref:DUF506 family protein n=1 Tax=Colocasia esculenta TaxID=4460 RepID=A0A843XVT8_COLES|nr:hypothetical protein [Colocasia esculenta]